MVSPCSVWKTEPPVFLDELDIWCEKERPEVFHLMPGKVKLPFTEWDELLEQAGQERIREILRETMELVFSPIA